MKNIKAWMHRHHNSISSFTSNFIATVLGIVMTLGTTVLYDRCQQSEAAEVLVEQCLSNMEERLADIDKVIEFYDLHDSIFQVMNNTPLDSLNEEELNDIINIICVQKHLVANMAYEKLFSQSTNTLETLGRFSQVIGEGFETLKYAEDNHTAINLLKKDFEREIILNRITYNDMGSMFDVVKTIAMDPQFVVFCREFNEHEHSVRYMHRQLKHFIPAARHLWQKEMSYDEFWTGAKGGWR